MVSSPCTCESPTLRALAAHGIEYEVVDGLAESNTSTTK